MEDATTGRERLSSSTGLLGTLRRSKGNNKGEDKKDKKSKKEKKEKGGGSGDDATTGASVVPRIPLSPRKGNNQEDGSQKMNPSADPQVASEPPPSPRRSLKQKLTRKRSDRRLSINLEATEMWKGTNSAPVPVLSSPGRHARSLGLAASAGDAQQESPSLADKWKKNSAGSPAPAADKEGIKNLRAAYQAKKAQIMGSSSSAVTTASSDTVKSSVPPPPPERGQRPLSPRGAQAAGAASGGRTSYDETDLKDRSMASAAASKAARAIKMLKRKSLAVPVRDLKDLKHFGDATDEEEAKTEVNVLVLGDAGPDELDLKSRLIERYMEHVRAQNSVHVTSDTPTIKTLDLATADNRPVSLKLINYAADKVDPLTLSKVNVALVVFSVVAPASLDGALTQWLPKARTLCNSGGGAHPSSSPSVATILVGAQADLRATASVSIPQDLAQGCAFAQTNECHAYHELANLDNGPQVARVFDEAVLAVASPVQLKEAAIFVDSLKRGAERLVLSHKNLTTATLSCLVASEERKAGLAGVRCLVLSHNALTHLPAFVFDMPQLEELRLDNNRLVELDEAIGDRLPNLRVLDLHNNELPALPPSIGRLHRLDELNLNGNPLEDEALLSPSVQFIRSYLAHPTEWTERGVQLWLDRCGMPRYKQIFFENDIDGEVLLSLDEFELREFLGVTEPDVPRLLDAIATLSSAH